MKILCQYNNHEDWLDCTYSVNLASELKYPLTVFQLASLISPCSSKNSAACAPKYRFYKNGMFSLFSDSLKLSSTFCEHSIDTTPTGLEVRTGTSQLKALLRATETEL